MPLVRNAATPFPDRAVQRARAALRRNIERMAELNSQSAFLADVRGLAVAAAPASIETAAWPQDVAELSDKIRRQQNGGLRPFEAPVRNGDRDMVKANLPRGSVQMDDPALDAARRPTDPRYC